MFTGLVEALGTVNGLHLQGGGARLSVVAPGLASELKLGESVAVNGVCLTVVKVREDLAAFDLGPETLARTNLGSLAPGDAVNLERALRLGDRLGGHWVQGHVDGVGTIASVEHREDWDVVAFRCPAELTRFMAPKGSIAVDGVSLTLIDVLGDGFTVMLIPHTLASTTLGSKTVGAAVNLETDVLAKYVQRLTSPPTP